MVDGDITFSAKELITAAQSDLFSGQRRYKPGHTISRNYQRGIKVVMDPVLEEKWGDAVRGAVQQWNNLRFRTPEGITFRSNIEMSVGSWAGRVRLKNKITVVKAAENAGTSSGDAPVGGRPGRFLKLTKNPEHGTKAIETTLHELGHVLGIFHLNQCDLDAIPFVHDWCAHGPPSGGAVMASGLGHEKLTIHDRAALVMLYRRYP